MPNPTPDAYDPTYSNCVNNPTDQVVTLACIPNLLENIIVFGLDLAGIVCLIVIIISGIRFMTARGDPKEITTAKNSILWAIVGLVLILLSFLIINLIGALTGATCIEILNQNFGNCHT